MKPGKKETASEEELAEEGSNDHHEPTFDSVQTRFSDDDNHSDLDLTYRKRRSGDFHTTTSMYWVRQAALQDIPDAQFTLGMMLEHNQETRFEPKHQAYAEAVSWYRKAAMQGHAGAMYNLGLMYRRGRGVEQDEEHCYHWHAMAASNGSPEAAKEIEELRKQM